MIPVKDLQRRMDDAEMFADPMKAYDAAIARLEHGEDELIPLEITEPRLKGEIALRIWREHRKLTQEQLAKQSNLSRALMPADHHRSRESYHSPTQPWLGSDIPCFSLGRHSSVTPQKHGGVPWATLRS